MSRLCRWILGSLLVVPLMACQSTTSNCLELMYTVTPSDTTIAVGASFTPVVQVSGCVTEHTPRQDAFSWSSADSQVVRVEPGTGKTTAIAPGTTTVEGEVTPMGASVRTAVEVVR